MKKQLIIVLMALIFLSACKSSKKVSDQGGTTPSSADTGAVKENQNTDIGAMLDQIASEIKTTLKDVEVSRTKEGVLVTFDPQVSFNTDSYQLKPKAKKNIESLGTIMKKYEATHISISGHADSTGVQANNLRLSQDRADAFATELKSYALASQRLETVVGYGAAKPKATNKTAEGRRANRRIDGLITINEKDLKR